jgi:hypothetical protein
LKNIFSPDVQNLTVNAQLVHHGNVQYNMPSALKPNETRSHALRSILSSNTLQPSNSKYNLNTTTSSAFTATMIPDQSFFTSVQSPESNPIKPQPPTDWEPLPSMNETFSNTFFD